MDPSFDALQDDVRRADAFFNDEKCTTALPFVHSYPRGSCEIVSAVLAQALQQKYKEAPVQVAMGYDPQLNEWHFWVEIGEIIVDATAHQFAKYQGPLVIRRPSPLEDEYPHVERISPMAAIKRLPKVTPAVAERIVSALLGGAVQKRSATS